MVWDTPNVEKHPSGDDKPCHFGKANTATKRLSGVHYLHKLETDGHSCRSVGDGHLHH